MKIVITENQHKMLIESVVNDTEFRNLIKGYESTVDSIIKLNDLKSTELKPGQILKLK